MENQKEQLNKKRIVRNVLLSALGLGTVASIVASCVSSTKLEKNDAKMKELEIRQNAVISDVRSDENFMDWFEDRYNLATQSYEEGLIDAGEYNNAVENYGSNEYIRTHINELDFVDQETKLEQADIINNSNVCAQKDNDYRVANSLTVACGITTSVTGIGVLAIDVINDKFKKKDKEQLYNESSNINDVDEDILEMNKECR